MYQGFREEATMLQEQESGPSVIAACNLLCRFRLSLVIANFRELKEFVSYTN